MANTYYVDGKFVPDSDAALPLNDLGLLRGFGVFDFMRTYSGKPIFIADHLKRLSRSAAQIGIDLPWSESELAALVHEALGRNDHVESNVRIVVTGGPSPDFITPQGKPRLVIMVTPLSRFPEGWYADGAKIITVDHGRAVPGAKSTDYLRAIMVLAEARRQHAIEVVYTDPEGWVYEGTTSNLFAVINGRLVTPGERVLHGITRQKTIALAEKTAPVDVRNLQRHELFSADEVFITSSNRLIVPIVQVNEQRIADGKPGKRTRELMEAFSAYTAALAAAAQ
jgi:branched-chain amino acid aminotransferase